MNKKKQYLSGVHAAMPVILGFIPAGIAYAIMARQAGFTILQTCGMSLTVFAGASQMMAAGMYGNGASIIAIILVTFILNLRHLIMSVCVFKRMECEKTGIKLLAAYGVTDESFAIFTTEKKEKCTAAYFMGMVTVNYISWNVGTLIGAVALDFLPAAITASLGIALYAMFIGLLMPGLKGNWKLCALAALTAVCNSLLTQYISSGWALILSTLLCAFIGVFFVELEEEENDERS